MGRARDDGMMLWDGGKVGERKVNRAQSSEQPDIRESGNSRPPRVYPRRRRGENVGRVNAKLRPR